MHQRLSHIVRSLLCICSTYALLTHALCAQSGARVIEQIAGKSFHVPQLDVQDIIQDSDGFIWMATLKGLIRYDGHQMLVFRENPADPGSITDNRLKILLEDKQGFLWVGTESRGLLRYDRRKERFTRFLHDSEDSTSISDNRIRAILQDNQGRIWIGTMSGLNRFDSETGAFLRFSCDPEDKMNWEDCYVQHRGLAQDSLGRIWISSWNRGLICWDMEQGWKKEIKLNNTLPGKQGDSRFTRIIAGQNGYLWAASMNARLNRIDPRNFQVQPYLYLSPAKVDENASNIAVIKESPAGSLFLGTFGRGLYQFFPHSGEIQSFQHDPSNAESLASDQVMALCLGQAGDLWVGHRGPALSRLSNQTDGFEILPFSSTLPPNLSAKVLAEDQLGNYWVGTWENGLFHIDAGTGKVQHFLHQKGKRNSLSNNIVWDILLDDQGYVWLATHNGLQRINPKQADSYTTFAEEEGLRRSAVQSLCQLRDGRIAIGTFGGLHWYDPKTETIELDSTLPNNMMYAITKIFEDHRGDLWIGALDNGLFVQNHQTKKWSHFTKRLDDPTSLSANNVWGIAEDDRGRVWLGTQGGGLNLFVPHATMRDSSTFKHWRSYNSDLPDENISHLIIDEHQILWLSTDLGLFSFDTKTERLSPHALPGGKIGLNVITRPGPTGAYYLGNSKNFYRFFPDSLVHLELPPPVFISGLQIQDRPVPVQHTFGDTLSSPSPLHESILYAKDLKLEFWQNDLTFTFLAIDYRNPSNNRYAFTLEGYREDTVFTDASQRYARYTNLAPGKYVFRVFAANSAGIWNWEGSTIHIQISPPWWRTYWAYVLWGILLFGFLYAFYRFQLHRKLEKAEHLRLAELDALKTRLYANITHEFRTPLTVIIGMSEQIKHQVSESVKNNLSIVRRNGKQLLDLVNQLLDLSKLEAGRLPLHYEQGDIISYLRNLLESFYSLAAHKGIHLHFESDLTTFLMDFDRTRLMHVLSNLLANAIKFSKENSDIRVKVAIGHGKPVSTPHFQISVLDTGSGIPPDQLPYIFDRFYQVNGSVNRGGVGIGLTLVKELVHLMKGKILVSSELGKGSTFTVILPVTREEPLANLAKESTVKTIKRVTPKKTTAPSPQEGQIELLIVEDNLDLQEYLATSLKGLYSLAFARNGAEGMQQALQLVPDLIITDVMMPEVDGFELCRMLRNHEITSHIPIIMLTAKVELEARLSGLRRGADAYLGKPFVEEELKVRIEALLRQRQQLQAYYRSQAGISEISPDNAFAAQDHRQESEFLQRVNRVLEQNLANEHFSIEQLARELFVDPSNLYRKLKALTNLNPTQYLRAYRLSKAKQLLLTTQLSITSIAAECGFSHHNYFSRVFKKETGLSPSNFRSKAKV